MQISGTTNNSALQTLQSLINSLETTGISTTNASAGAGQNVQGGQTASLIAGPLPSPPAASSLSNQFSPASLAFLTSLQASDSASASTSGVAVESVSLTKLNQGLTDLTSALKEIQTALTGSAQTQSAGAASLTGASATSTASASSASLTSSAMATVLSELNAVLNGLESAATPSSQHAHHHHHRTESAASGSTSSSSNAATTTTTGATDTTTNNTAAS